MTQDQIVELGIRAEALLQSKTFSFVVAHLTEQYTNAMLQSAPNEQDKREHLYHLNRALSDVVSQLSSYVTSRDTILAARAQDEQEEEE